MNNVTPYGPRDEASTLAGDVAFVGVDERTSPQQLAAGYVAGARNKRFRNGRAATREGIALLPWCRGTGLTPFTTVYGAAVFADPDQGDEWIIIAADGGVWKTRPNTSATAVPLPAGVTLTAATFAKFVQANSAIVLLRGLATDSLICENLQEGFKVPPPRNEWDCTFDHATNRVTLTGHNSLIGDPVRFTGSVPAAITVGQVYFILDIPDADTFTLSETAGGTQQTWNTSDTDTAVDSATVEVLDGASPMPPAVDGYFHLNRLLLITGKDTGALSDIGDPLRYQPQLQSFRVNEGDSHTLVTAAPFNDDTVVFLKSGNVRKAVGVNGDLSTAAGPLNVTDAYGAASPSVAGQGTDLYWLTSELRISSLRLTELNKEQDTNVALSDPLVQTFGRINAAYAHRARLVSHDGYLRVALPLDTAEIVSPVEIAGDGDYSAAYPQVLPVVAGQTYQYRQGANGGSIRDTSAGISYYGDTNFVPTGSSVSLFPAAALGFATVPCTDSLRLVQAEGVNTGVAVYDFQNQAWAGVDEADELLAVIDWLKFTYGGRQRLGFIGADGYLHLCDEGFEDERVATVDYYTDVVARPFDPFELFTVGDTLQVNGGTLVTGVGGNDNSASTIGVGDFMVIQVGPNLWQDGSGRGGYDATATSPWSAPNTTTEEIEDGVRFVATNGAAIQIKVNGTVVTGPISQLIIDAHGGPEIGPVAISDWVRTRAYRCRDDAQRFTLGALQLATWAPQYTIQTLTQGTDTLRGETENTDVTRDRTKYFDGFETDDWVETNVNEDFHAPGREDYSWQERGQGILLGVAGVNFDQHQTYVHRVPLSERGLWLQLDVTNTSGRLELIASALEAQAGEVLGGLAVN